MEIEEAIVNVVALSETSGMDESDIVELMKVGALRDIAKALGGKK